MESYQPIIGLEVHIELKTASKMFCRCSTDYFGHEPNTYVCPICLGLPGALPMPNKKAIQWTILAGLALNCQDPTSSKFDRKNYFYPDLPKGYQISQYDLPLTRNGKVKMDNGKTIRIRRVHLEEDTAKLIHQPVEGERVTLIDFNRSGVPLMEIVTEPDFESPRQAREFLRKLQQFIRYLGISDCDMEKGSMRLEVNVSLRKAKSKGLPAYKVEIKNLNSFRFVEKALNYEIKRQRQIYKKGEKPKQETRGWDQIKQKTFPQRFKEEAQDYRYFPEPDIPPITWRKKDLEKIKKALPELASEKEARFRERYKIPAAYARLLATDRQKADFFEEAVKVGGRYQLTAKEMANVIVNKRVDLEKVLPASLVEILVKAKKKPKISPNRLEKIIEEVVKENEKAVKDYSSGRKQALEFLVGQVARKTKGKADAGKTRELLLEKIKR